VIAFLDHHPAGSGVNLGVPPWHLVTPDEDEPARVRAALFILGGGRARGCQEAQSAPVAIEAGDYAVEVRELEHAHCLRGHLSIDLKPPTVGARVFDRSDQSV
jgi:hypothetical protein